MWVRSSKLTFIFSWLPKGSSVSRSRIGSTLFTLPPIRVTRPLGNGSGFNYGSPWMSASPPLVTPSGGVITASFTLVLLGACVAVAGGADVWFRPASVLLVAAPVFDCVGGSCAAIRPFNKRNDAISVKNRGNIGKQAPECRRSKGQGTACNVRC